VNTLPVLSSAATSHQKTALGFESVVGTSTRVYGELRDTAGPGMSLPAAAFGVKDSWELFQGVRLAAGLERVQALSHAPAGASVPVNGGDSLAVTSSIQLNLAENWRAHARVEISRGDVEDTTLVTSGLAYKLSDKRTLLARQAYFRSERTTAPELQVSSRVQLGSAWRSVGRDALFLAEAVREPVPEGGSRDSGVFSVQYGEEVGDKLRLSTRLAARTSRDNTLGLATRSHAAVAGVRATWQVDSKWNVAAQAMYVTGSATRSLGVGLEAGYRFADNLWLVMGYNFMAARDPVLVRDDFSRGLYFRVRYLFDETALDAVMAK
jgi:large repetitive protein